MTVTLREAIAVVRQLSAEDQKALVHEIEGELTGPSDSDDDNWALEGQQLSFMLQYHEEIAAAYERGDMAVFDQLESSEEYQALFGAMSWDEAYDRYEETWWTDDEPDAA